MSDEIEEIEEETPEQPSDEVQEVTPLTDEQIAEALGVDVEYLKAVKPEIQNLKGFYSKVNKRNQDLVEQQKQLESKGAPPVVEDEDIDLDPQAQKVLRKFIQKEFAPLLSTIEAERTESAANLLDEFISEHRDVPTDRLYEAMEELGLWQVTNTPTKLKRALTTAYKYVKANSSDVEAEIERRVAAQLKSLKSDGVEIVDVKAKRSGIPTGTRTLGSVVDDPNMDWPEMMKVLQDD